MLIKKDDRIIRVLETKCNHKLIINCSQKSMPTWITEEDLSGYLGNLVPAGAGESSWCGHLAHAS